MANDISETFIATSYSGCYKGFAYSNHFWWSYKRAATKTVSHSSYQKNLENLKRKNTLFINGFLNPANILVSGFSKDEEIFKLANKDFVQEYLPLSLLT